LPNYQFHSSANVELVLQDFEVSSNLVLNISREGTLIIHFGRLLHRLIDLISRKHYLDCPLQLLVAIQNYFVSTLVCMIWDFLFYFWFNRNILNKIMPAEVWFQLPNQRYFWSVIKVSYKYAKYRRRGDNVHMGKRNRSAAHNELWL